VLKVADMAKDEMSAADHSEDLLENLDEETLGLLRLAKARNIGKDIFASEYDVRKRAKEKGISLFMAEKELIRESHAERGRLQKEANRLIKSKLSNDAKKKLGIKGAGRQKGSKNKNQKLSKKGFYDKLKKLAMSKAESDERLTQKEAAMALGLGGTRQLRRKLEEYGDDRRWRDIVDSLT
jgi:hypothetical protein